MTPNSRRLVPLPSFLVLIVACVVLAACSSTGGGRYYQDDGPPRLNKGPDPDSVPDALPRFEPLAPSGNSPYTALGQRFTPMHDARGFRQTGYASWYGRKYHGNRTSSGETYDMYAMTAAHPVLPLPTYVRVRNLDNGRTVVVKVNDRGPFLRSRIIDLSYMAARKLGIVATGTARVEIASVFPNDAPEPATTTRLAAAEPVSIAPVAAPTGSPVSSDAVALSTSAASGTAMSTVSAIVTPANAAEVPLFMLQAGSFASGGNAQNLVNRLRQGGYGNVRIERVRISGRDYHRVLVGPYETRQSAELIESTIEEYLGSPVSVLAQGSG